jgi:hypothetical protein
MTINLQVSNKEENLWTISGAVGLSQRNAIMLLLVTKHVPSANDSKQLEMDV